MSPEQMAERLAEWVDHASVWPNNHDRRVVCVEPEGPRRTWCLWEGSKQAGLVRMRNLGAEDMERDDCAPEWTVEASDRTRAMLGLGA